MLTNRAALGALAVFGVVAAGGGAYFAGRQHPVAETQAISAHDVALPAAGGAVTETENSLVPAAPEVQPQAAPAPVPAAPVRPSRQSVSRPAAPRPSARPSYSPQTPVTSSASAPVNPPVTASIEPPESTTVERRASVPEVPQKQYQELVIPADSVVGLQIDTAISSDRAKVEDSVKARVTRDVKVHDQVAIPAGARAEGSVTLVDKGGRLKDQARLGIRFHTLVLADGTRVPINTETIFRDGDAPTASSAQKVGGGAIGGAIIGAIIGGGKGAAIGAAAGAGAGSAAVVAGGRQEAVLAPGTALTARINQPVTVTVEKE